LTEWKKGIKIVGKGEEKMKYEKEVDFKRYVKIIKSSTYDETGYKNVLECKPHFHAAKEFLFVEEGEQPIVCGGELQTLTAATWT
jgi:hypothetical protein